MGQNISITETKEKESFNLFEINLLWLVILTVGIFGFFSFWVAVVIWLFSIVCFGRIWSITYKEGEIMAFVTIDGKLIEKIWRPLAYCLIFVTAFTCYNFSFWWWTGVGNVKNAAAFNSDALFVSFCFFLFLFVSLVLLFIYLSRYYFCLKKKNMWILILARY